MEDSDYSAFYVTVPDRVYTRGEVNLSRSYYFEPIDRTGRALTGNSRRWGDAPFETQRAAIDAIISAAKARGLSRHETAYVLAIVYHESGFNPDAAATKTSASGFGQFVNGTGPNSGLSAENRWDINAQADAVVDYFIFCRDVTVARNQDEANIYGYHHDGKNSKGNGDGVRIARQRVMPLVGPFESSLEASGLYERRPVGEVPQFVKDREPKVDWDNVVFYRVQAGDTLSKIAQGMGGRPEEIAKDIARVNNIADPTRISIGQQLMLPGKFRRKETATRNPSENGEIQTGPVSDEVRSINGGKTAPTGLDEEKGELEPPKDVHGSITPEDGRRARLERQALEEDRRLRHMFPTMYQDKPAEPGGGNVDRAVAVASTQGDFAQTKPMDAETEFLWRMYRNSRHLLS
jgi:LysM repeat protein